MIVDLGETTYWWRRQNWGPGLTDIPNDLADVLGLLTQETEPEALALINAATTIEELFVLPTVGKRAAEHLINNRPEFGYKTFQEVMRLNADLTSHPNRVVWEKVRGWGDV